MKTVVNKFHTIIKKYVWGNDIVLRPINLVYFTDHAWVAQLYYNLLQFSYSTLRP